MSSILYLRMSGYAATLVLHLTNIMYINNALEGSAFEDPNIRAFSDLYMRFFTVWTFLVQMFYAAIGLTCDYLTLKNAANGDYQLPKYLKYTRDSVFSAILWPSAFLVCILFWTLYNYDRNLIYPSYADKLVTSTSNHILHTAIIPIVIWEVLFQPRTVKKSHSTNLTMLTVYMVTYLNIMCYTYLEKGIWMYPIFGIAHNTIWFPLIIGIIGGMLCTFYYMQWAITALVWGSKIKTEKGNNFYHPVQKIKSN